MHTVDITASYYEHSYASGALFTFVFVDDGFVDFTKQILITIEKDDLSQNHTLSFGLSAGQYKAFVYDIELDGTLFSGVGYPAVTEEFLTTGIEGTV